MYLYVSGIDFASSYDYFIDFGHFRTVSYFCIMFHFINSVVNHYVVDAITDRIKLKK